MVSKIRVRRCCLTDCYFLWKLRNTEDIRKVSWHTEYIRFWAHLRWFFRAYFLGEHHIWVGWYDGIERCGYLRVDAGPDTRHTVSVAVAPPFRRRGVARAMLRTAMDEIYLWDDDGYSVLVAFIDTDNFASQKLFKSCGFVQKTPMMWEHHYAS